MSDEDYKPEGQGMNPTDDEDTTVESTENEDEVVEDEDTSTDETNLVLELERKKNYELMQRLKKAEAKAKKQRTDLESPDVPTSDNAIQEQVLRANGMPAELIGVLKKISADKGVDLLEAQSDDYFIYKKDRFEQEKRDAEAQLGASKGSGQGKPKKDFTTPNLTQEDHKKMWQRAMQK